MKKRFAKVDETFFPLAGGLDLLTPAISMPPGRTFDCVNYEPEISGGYRRIDGYERFDGHPSPTENAKYVTVKATLTATVAIDAMIVGSLSGTTGKLVGMVTFPAYTLLIISGVDATTGTYFTSESLKVGAAVVGMVIEDSMQASDAEEDADYTLLAANDIRRAILPVPGSGPIRGVFSLADDVYAFRDNENATAQQLWKASPTGWIPINYGKEIQYIGGSIEVQIGQTITSPSGASGMVGYVTKRTGTWNTGADPKAEGTILFTFGSVTGNWTIGENIIQAGVICAQAGTPVTNITRLPGGKLEIIKHAYGIRTGNQVIYGADGVNSAFEFSGPFFVPIRTGMFTDTPEHIAEHLNHLFLSYGPSIQFSSVNNPYSWTVVLGAGEFTAGDKVSGMLSMTGNNQANAMAVFTKSKVSMLYGSGLTNFRLQNSVSNVGYSPYTIQPISGTAFGLTARGMQTLEATQVFGDFTFSSISGQIQPIINRLRGLESCSIVLKNKNQYRVYYGDSVGTCLAVGLTGEKVSGIMPLNYGRPVRCTWNETFSNGKERTFFGSDDGYVYEDNKGTSFDGQPIESWLRLVFNHGKSPGMRKRYRRAVLEARVESFCKVNFSYDLGYGNPDVSPPPLVQDTALVGGPGGYWEQFIWDMFIWDARAVISPSLTLEGTERNISMIFYSSRAQDGPHTLQGITMLHSDRRLER